MIPSICHFIWLGKEFQWPSLLALRSAAIRGEFDAIILHHEGHLSTPEIQKLQKSFPNIETWPLDLDQLFGSMGTMGSNLLNIYNRLDHHAARANLLRLLILYQYGGVYLDIDTITIASLQSLLHSSGVFCGNERIIFPITVVESTNPVTGVVSALRVGFRELMRRITKGWKIFRLVEHFYPLAVNNAILGAEKEHPFIWQLLQNIETMPPQKQQARYALGVHLLQKGIANNDRKDVVVYPPEFFFPLGPEISEHYFKIYSGADIRKVQYPTTRIIHWYASVRTRDLIPTIDENYIREHAHHQLFSALASEFL